MAIALSEARSAAERGEVPVGAVLVGPIPTDELASPAVLSRESNRTRALCDPTAHAEILCLRAAAAAQGYERLVGCTLFTTVEPCFMCAGALVHARVARVVFGVRDDKFGGVVSLARSLDVPGLNHRVAYTEGVSSDEARVLLQDFFRSKR